MPVGDHQGAIASRAAGLRAVYLDLSSMTTDDIRQLVTDYAYGCGINPNVALAQINRESGFNPDAVGSSGELGITQFMPATWQRFGYGPHTNARDPNLALDAWCAYMQFLLNRYSYNYRLALEGYNGGEGNVDRGTVSSAAQGYAASILSAAGADEWGNPWPDGGAGPGPGLEHDSHLPTLAIAGAIVLGLILILRS